MIEKLPEPYTLSTRENKLLDTLELYYSKINELIEFSAKQSKINQVFFDYLNEGSSYPALLIKLHEILNDLSPLS